MKKMDYKTISSFDRTVHSLCQEIDDLKFEVEIWKSRFEEERKARMELLGDVESQTKKDLANALLFALSVNDDSDGNLVIPKERREILAERYSDDK